MLEVHATYEYAILRYTMCSVRGCKRKLTGFDVQDADNCPLDPPPFHIGIPESDNIPTRPLGIVIPQHWLSTNHQMGNREVVNRGAEKELYCGMPEEGMTLRRADVSEGWHSSLKKIENFPS